MLAPIPTTLTSQSTSRRGLATSFLHVYSYLDILPSQQPNDGPDSFR
jgi:hypothetical protein